MQVVQSQLNARYGRTNGGAINIVTKSGSNTWEGTIRANRLPALLDHQPAQGLHRRPRPVGNQRQPSRYSQYTDITFSGPIIKDRLWFFLGTRLEPTVAGSARIGWGTPGVMQHYQQRRFLLDGPAGQLGDLHEVPPHHLRRLPERGQRPAGRAWTPTGCRSPGVAGLPRRLQQPEPHCRATTAPSSPPTPPSTATRASSPARSNTDNTLALTFLYAKTTAGRLHRRAPLAPEHLHQPAFVGDAVTRTNGLHPELEQHPRRALVPGGQGRPEPGEHRDVPGSRPTPWTSSPP